MELRVKIGIKSTSPPEENPTESKNIVYIYTLFERNALPSKSVSILIFLPPPPEVTPVLESQSLMVLPSDAEARSWPSGEKATALTGYE